MKRLWNKLRFTWCGITKMLPYSSSFLDTTYKIYLNHSKVIHFRDGCPVYSLATPALYSKPQANLFARQFYKTITSKNLPNLMSFAVTPICNAECKHCSFFEGAGPNKDERPMLTLTQAQKLIRDAQDIGVSLINFTGGEPLIREDLPEIIGSINKDLSQAILFTNGWFLADKIDQLRKAGLDGVYISIDSADPEKHDEFRRTKGLFHRAINGIKKAKALGLTTGISCTITPESFKDGELTRIIELAKKTGVHEVLVNDALPTGRMRHRADLDVSTNWVEEMIESVKPYNDDVNYPGILVWAHTTSHRGLGCSCGANYFYVTPHGDICSCDFNHMIFGNVLKTPLFSIWDQMTSMDDFCSTKWGGCKIKDAEWQKNRDTVSSTFRVYEKQPESLRNEHV